MRLQRQSNYSSVTLAEVSLLYDGCVLPTKVKTLGLKMDVRAIRPSYKRVLVSDPLNLASREYYDVSGSLD
jgi:hypothetical protein